MAADPQVTIPIPGLQAMSLRLSDSSSGTTGVNISNCPSDSDIQQVAGGSSFFQSNKMDVFLVLFNREMVFVAIFPGEWPDQVYAGCSCRGKTTVSAK